jgi:hypothetical protein
MSCQHLNFETGSKVGRLFEEGKPANVVLNQTND